MTENLMIKGRQYYDVQLQDEKSDWLDCGICGETQNVFKARSIRNRLQNTYPDIAFRIILVELFITPIFDEGLFSE